MSLFSKKTKEEARDDYIEFGNMAHITDDIKVTVAHNVYGATFEEMLARLGKVTCDNNTRSAFIVQQFMTLKERDEIIDRNRRNKPIDKQD